MRLLALTLDCSKTTSKLFFDLIINLQIPFNKIMKFLGFLVVCLTAVSGFVVPAPRVSTVVRPATSSTAMRMGLKEDFQKAATGASVALLTAAPALATEGTGEVR